MMERWEIHKGTLRKLFLEEGMILQEVIGVMEDKYNFHARHENSSFQGFQLTILVARHNMSECSENGVFASAWTILKRYGNS